MLICEIQCQNIRLCVDKELRKQNEIKFTHIRVKTKRKKKVFAAKLVLFSPEILEISPQNKGRPKKKGLCHKLELPLGGLKVLVVRCLQSCSRATVWEPLF